MNQDEMTEALARLRALHDNLPGPVAQRYIDDFHEILGLVQKNAGVALSRFMVPGSAIVEKATLRDRAYYDLDFVKAKIGGLLGLFELRGAQPRPHVGFRPQ